MRITTFSLITFLFFSGFITPVIADNFYWRGITSEFNSASNWVKSDNTVWNRYPGEGDDVFFDSDDAAVKKAVTSSLAVNMRNITCTSTADYTFSVPTTNVYGNIELNGHLIFINQRRLNLLGATQNTINLGGVAHAINLWINKPGGGITSTNHIDLALSDINMHAFVATDGDFSIDGYNITSTTGFHFRTPTLARTVTLNNCTITTTFTHTANNRVDSSDDVEFTGTRTTYVMNNCNLITSNEDLSFQSTLNFNSLTLHTNGNNQIRFRNSAVLNIGSLNINGNSKLILDGSGGASNTNNIDTLNLNVPTSIFKSILDLNDTYNPVANYKLNVGVLNENVASCANRSSFSGITLNSTKNLINTSHITYMGCIVDGFGFQTSKENNAGSNSGAISWTDNNQGTRYYWIGGNGIWDDANQWVVGSFSGSSNGCIPTAIDTVYFDPATAEIVTLTTAAACRAIYWPGPSKGGQITANGGSLSVFGDADFSGANEFRSYLFFPNNESQSNDFIFKSDSADFYKGNNKICFNHQGTYTFLSDCIFTSGDIIQNSGNIITNGFSMSARNLKSINTANVRSLDLSGSTITVSGNIELNAMRLTLDVSDTDIIFTGPLVKLQITGSFPVAPKFHNVTFSNTSTDASSIQVQTGTSYDNLTFNCSGDLTGVRSFSVGNLTLSPLRTYTFAGNSTVTINNSLNPRTGGCNSITLTGGSSKTTIVNNTGEQMSIPGGILTRIYYTKGSDGTNLQVPNGENVSGNDPYNIDFIERAGRSFYWIGDGGNWTDPNHWALTDSTEVYDGITVFPAYNPEGCIPEKNDTAYFTGNSFTTTGQTIVMNDNNTNIVSMIWTAPSGTYQPTWRPNTMRVSGSIQFAPGVIIGKVVETYWDLYFTGISLTPDAQKFDTRGITYSESNFYWQGVSLGTGRYDWYGTFPLSGGGLKVQNCDFYAHESSFSSPVSSSTTTGHITQSPGRIVDISNSTFLTSRSTIVTTITISECTNFNGEGAVFKQRSGMTFKNNDTSCIVNFDAYEPYENNTILTSNGLGTVHFNRINYTAAIGQITGKVEVDRLSLANRRGSLKIGTTVDTVKILKSITYPGTPCDEFYIESAVTGTRANLQLPDCDKEYYFLFVKDINAVLPEYCATGNFWKVHGTDLGNNSSNIQFSPAPATGINNIDASVKACKPYRFEVPGAMNASSISNTTWYRNGIQITAAKNQLFYDITQDGTYQVNVVYNASSSGCVSTFNNPISFFPDFVWTAGANSSDWNDKNNWDISSVPDACSYVIIPGGLNYYPILEPEDLEAATPVPAAICDTIDIKFGGEVKNTHLLTYNGAKVEMTVSSNQWHMLSAPLKQIYTGDYYVDHYNPHLDLDGRGMLVHMMHFHIPNYQTNATLVEYDWNNTFNTNDIELGSGQGFALFANPRGSGFTDHEDLTFNFPKKDSIHYYYNISGAITGQGAPLDRTKSYRFIYEDDIDSNGIVTLKNPEVMEDGKSVLIGNPFMTHLNFDNFAARNTAWIYDEYRLAYGTAVNDGYINQPVTYKKLEGDYYSSDPTDASLTSLIPPMQSFIVTSRGALTELTVHAQEDTQIDPDNTLRSGRKTLPVLNIIASRGKQKSKAILVRLDGASDTYQTEEDSRRLFPKEENRSVLIYTVSSDNYALDINSMGELKGMIPVGIRTSEIGKITLNFSGMEEFADQSIYLHDTKENKVINLSETDEYIFFKLDDEVYINDRFFISFKTITSIDSLVNPACLCWERLAIISIKK